MLGRHTASVRHRAKELRQRRRRATLQLEPGRLCRSPHRVDSDPLQQSVNSFASGGIGAIAPLRPIHPKDIEKPEKYDTVADGWLEWSKGFLNFLDRNDSPHNRWSALLKQVEALKGRPITSQDEADWQSSLGIGNIANWKAQLEAYLSSYTKGRAREIVRNAGTSGALDAWRILADKGYSQRPIHQSARRAKAYAQRKNVNLKDLEMAIMRWETDVRLFEEAGILDRHDFGDGRCAGPRAALAR